MDTVTEIRPAYHPPIPDTFDKLGISENMVMDLMLKRLYVGGQSNIQTLADALKLSPIIVETVFRQIRQQQLIEVKGMTGNDYNFALTSTGRNLAMERFQLNQYAGASPVSLTEYHRATKAQSAKVHLNRRVLRNALSDLVLTDALLDQLGPAFISQSSIFLYGPTGNGKTSLAERLLRVYQDAIMVPYAVEVDSQIILLYDPVVHERIELPEQDYDPRFVCCKRPAIIAGGELVHSMLELKLDEATGIYAAPIQMKSNNGIFIVDDFGRQSMSPRELLNRWIVPLDRRVDYLTLRYGVKFQIPFELLVVFATNLDPRDLADEAFLRRIQNKVYVESVKPEIFDEIFWRVVKAKNIPAEPDSAEYLRSICLRDGRTELRACYPGDVCNILVSISRYESKPVKMTKPDLERAVALYFAQG